jgi:hypothetical protein
MALSAPGTTFGIFGPWGSGKTSAIKALQRDIANAARVPLQQSDSVAIVYVDCSGLRSASPENISTFVQAELARSGVVRGNSELENHIFKFFRVALELSKVAVPDPIGKAGIALATRLAEEGQKTSDHRQAVAVSETASKIEKAFVLLDGLDRCDADGAWAILRNARWALPSTKIVVAIACDPVVLGHHISHVLGVPLASGFQAVLKYIDVPLKIPTSSTETHRVSIQSRLQPGISPDWLLAEVAYEAVGNIPMRDILAALPQACLWLETWDSRLRPKYVHRNELKDIAEVVFFFALMYACVPNAAQVIGSGKRDWLEFSSSFATITHGYTGPMRDSSQTAIQHGFGGTVQDVVEARMDLVRFGRARDVGKKLASVQTTTGPVWTVLWDMVRS